MQFFSTRDQNRKVTSSEAIAQGLSNEGGLFVPESFPQVDVKALCELDYPAMAAAVIKEYLTDYSQDFLTEAARKTYGDAFGGKAGYLAPVEGDTYALELWHGPTCAFKDYALQLMPKLLVEAKKNLGRTEKTLILVATSGDTGKAALDGYHDIPGVEIAVFFPTGGTSEIQRLQMVTQEGENVAVYAVRGNFDDCQTSVKRMFDDATFNAHLLDTRNIALSSANSINWGRLLPQVVYYISAYSMMVKDGVVAAGDPIDVTVPTGNFGNILACWYAKQLGVPIDRIVCASNANRVLADFIETGVYDISDRPFMLTPSPSMDILVSSNLERQLFELTGRDAAAIQGWMDDLREKRRFELDEETFAALQQNYRAGSVDSDTCLQTIHDVFEQHDYLLDPHTAVAWKVAEQQKGDNPMLIASTANWAKFGSNVYRGLAGIPADEPLPADVEELTDVQLNRKVYEMTRVCPIPPQLDELDDKAIRFTTVIDGDVVAIEDAVTDFIG